jgi:hypothetical protein
MNEGRGVITFGILRCYYLPMRLDDTLFRRHLEDDEAVVAVIHRHWLLGTKSLFWPTLALAAGGVLLAAAPYRPIAIAVGIWSVLVLIWWVRNFFDYFLDAWILTDQGIIDVAWHGWFHRESSRILYSDIQGVSYEIQGVLATLLRFGTVSVEKISTGSTISLDHVPRPRAVEARILRQMEEYLHSKNLKDAKHVQELLSAVLAREAQLQEFEDESPEDEK